MMSAPIPYRSLRLPGFVWVAAWMGLAGCTGDTAAPEATPTATTAAADQIAPELVAASWPLQMCDDAKRAPFEAHPGWGAMFQRDLPGALAAFRADPGDGRGLARVHSDLASIAGQAAKMGAHATVHIYGKDAQPTDPLESQYLYGVAQGILGACEESGGALAKVTAPSEAIARHHSFWTARAGESACGKPISPDELAGLPGSMAPFASGEAPELPALPHHTFVEQSDAAREVATGELTHLYSLSVGHRAAALSAAPESERDLVAARLAPWGLPVDPSAGSTDSTMEVHPEWLFLDFALVGADLYFLQAAKREGLAAVGAWKDRSLLASALAPAVSPDGLSVETVIDRAATLRTQLKESMMTASGSAQPFHPGFAQMGEVAVLRAGMIVADANDQYRDAGILRINALERSDGASRDPVFLISTAAWDAGNRSPLRAQEIVHGLVARYPFIRAALYPLDALHIRLGRTAAPTTAVH